MDIKCSLLEFDYEMFVLEWKVTSERSQKIRNWRAKNPKTLRPDVHDIDPKKIDPHIKNYQKEPRQTENLTNRFV